ncbi:hypothetical protein KHA76_001771 [Salmonella enterica subsp. houtenae serovar 44:z36,[z38]:-]|uniref:DUF3742 family protein n=1 Tax=Salmonella enterica subsp. houtenae serovar 44:z36[z38]:- TaxID=1967609 RepID=A0A736MEQ6_SALHO|nr:hypothetical protein [Salmonella enterica]EHM8757081.1 hypothetical protein [Salmonella enterica subsp. houtenae serovar 44:z36,[z38]:-]HAE7580874.1 DUF3742 family protein [Salmonella enterica subsp. houtenae serovar 44:z36[z38]:-]HCM6266669.1 hypothetical protein [Salmonella enterica subsp. houtenae serovar 44:z36,Z38:-]EGF3877497.1 DUF3742 family protein [Salmonella enterica]
MKKDNIPSEQSDIWTVLFNGLAEAMKILFSIIIAIVVAGSKTTVSKTSSTESEDHHSGFRNGHSGPGYYDSNDQKLRHFDD